MGMKRHQAHGRKGRRPVENKVLPNVFGWRGKSLSFDSFITRNPIHKHAMMIDEYVEKLMDFWVV